MDVNEGELEREMELGYDEVRKYFQVGEHVKVMAGQHKGKTGTLITVKDNIEGSVFCDNTKRELRVNLGDLIATSEVATGSTSLAGWTLYDMVQMRNYMGVIVKIEMNGFKLMDINRNIFVVRLQDMGIKKNIKDAVTEDVNGMELVKDDGVKVVAGDSKGISGTIKHIFRNNVFIHSKDISDNVHSGIVVMKGTFTQKLGAQGQLLKRRVQNEMPASPMINAGGQMITASAGAAGSRMNITMNSLQIKALRNDPLIGKLCIITGGSWKGKMGKVLQAQPDSYKLELRSLAKVVQVPRQDVQLKTVDEADTFASASSMQPKTPYLGDKTVPHWQTQGLGSATPRAGAGIGLALGMTPRPESGVSDGFSRTPRRQGAGSGSADLWAPTPKREQGEPIIDDDDDNNDYNNDYNAPYGSNYRNEYDTLMMMRNGSGDQSQTQSQSQSSSSSSLQRTGPGGREADADRNPSSSSEVLIPGMVCVVGGEEVVVTGLTSSSSINVRKVRNGASMVVDSKDLRRAQLRAKDHVVVLIGRLQGKTGTINSIAGNEAVVGVGGDIEIFQLSEIGKMN
jgi:transcription elongation factor SPT5